MNLNNFPLTFIQIPRIDIESNKIENFMHIINAIFDKKLIEYAKQKLFITVSGYDNDERELLEIKEVRSYFKELNKTFKYWAYFCHEDNLIRVVLPIILQSKFVYASDGKITYIRLLEPFEPFLKESYTSFLELINKYNIEKDFAFLKNISDRLNISTVSVKNIYN